ncbi:MAG TPA: sigma-70 family RNA polymerase sigma factor [Bacillota bacterium]|nr:sigma-70 family RNA polymerase sigma factor [Bacillota bacterium]
MFQHYLNELSKIRLLPPDEEMGLWRSFKDEASREARRQLIESYQPLVFKIASRITGREDLFLDLIQEGTVGLIEAVENFVYEHGVKFSTYAQHRIRGRMIDFLKRHRSDRDTLEIAINQDDFQSILAEVVDQRINVEEEVTGNLINFQVNQAISRLNPKEQKVIFDLYLLDKEPAASAQEMNVSISYFYKLQKKALQRLRGMLTKLRAEIKSGR